MEKKANLASGVPPGAVLVPDTAHESDYKYIFPYSKDEKGKGLLVRVSGACRIARSPVSYLACNLDIEIFAKVSCSYWRS